MRSTRDCQVAQVRPALAGASALLVLGLIVTASLDPARSSRRELAREQMERVSVRELTATLAKAVRTLVETAAQKPVVLAASRLAAWDRDDGLVARRPVATDAAAPVVLLRHDLLDLPPPVLA